MSVVKVIELVLSVCLGFLDLQCAPLRRYMYTAVRNQTYDVSGVKTLHDYEMHNGESALMLWHFHWK